MTNPNDARRAHDVLDGLSAGRILSRENEQLLRSFLPELPKQKTLEEIIEHVYDAWMRTNYNEWAGNIDNPDILIEEWLVELHTQLQGLKGTPVNAPAHPEFLETEADYENAPFGTIVVGSNYYPWTKAGGSWLAYGAQPRNDFGMRACRRYVLRWGDK